METPVNEAGILLRVRELLAHSTQKIREALADSPPGFAETPYLDALVLLSDAWNISKEELLARMTEAVPHGVEVSYNATVGKRCDGDPISYIRGHKEFYGRRFLVDRRVLVPRPETELLVDQALHHAAMVEHELHVHDCCTGSGAVAITVAAEIAHQKRPRLVVSASDLSRDALTLAAKNSKAHLTATSQVLFAEGDLLEPVLTGALSYLPAPQIITANPPYLSSNEYAALESCGWPEPMIALASGETGLEHLNALCNQAIKALGAGGWLICEIGESQGESAMELFSLAGFADCTLERDLAGRIRICKGCKRSP